jgi:tRNA dimethylallyltransferase
LNFEFSPVVYVIAGPTAVGKTAIAVELAKWLGTSVVSADSRQCYKEMSIGTAKPSPAELSGVKHYFIDEFPVTVNLTAADYEQLALGYLNEIFKTRRAAIVCGGTGLYIKALCEGLDAMPEVDEQISINVNEAYKKNGMAWLQETIQAEDPEFYASSESENPARMIRALIFKRSTGESILNFRTGTKRERYFETIKIGLELPREVLYERINQRVDNMMEAGLLDEVKSLYPQRHLKNLQTVGYAELFDYLDNKCSLAEAVNKIKQHTRNYAKRQMTWFRKEENISWLRADDPHIVDHIKSKKPHA